MDKSGKSDDKSMKLNTAGSMNIIRIVGPNWCQQFKEAHGYKIEDTRGYSNGLIKKSL